MADLKKNLDAIVASAKKEAAERVEQLTDNLDRLSVAAQRDLEVYARTADMIPKLLVDASAAAIVAAVHVPMSSGHDYLQVNYAHQPLHVVNGLTLKPGPHRLLIFIVPDESGKKE